MKCKVIGKSFFAGQLPPRAATTFKNSQVISSGPANLRSPPVTRRGPARLFITSVTNLEFNPRIIMSRTVSAPGLQSPPAWKPKVLLVDGDFSGRRSLSLMLETENFQVVAASNAKEALEHYFEGYIDLALLDLNMPLQHGWDTFERLTALNPYLAIILITEHLNERELPAAAGASAIMEKPLKVSQLVRTMADLVEEPLEARLQRMASRQPLLLRAES